MKNETRRFGSLLKSRFIGSFASLVVFIFIAPTLFLIFDNRIIINLLYLFIIGTSLYAVKQSRKLVAFSISFAVLGMSFQGLYFVNESTAAAVAGHSFLFLFYLSFVKTIVIDLLTLKTTSTDSLCEAVVGYLMIAAAFAELYKVIYFTVPNAFSGLDGAGALSYFSIVTLTTLGYGDILPSSPYAKSLVSFEAVTGVFYMAVLVSHLVSGIARNRESSDS